MSVPARSGRTRSALLRSSSAITNAPRAAARRPQSPAGSWPGWRESGIAWVASSLRPSNRNSSSQYRAFAISMARTGALRLPVDIEGASPGSRLVVPEIIGAEAREVISLWPHMVVDDVQDHRKPQHMRRVHERAQVVGPPIAPRRREQRDAVVAPVPVARKIGDRHELDGLGCPVPPGPPASGRGAAKRAFRGGTSPRAARRWSAHSTPGASTRSISRRRPGDRCTPTGHERPAAGTARRRPARGFRREARSGRGRRRGPGCRCRTSSPVRPGGAAAGVVRPLARSPLPAFLNPAPRCGSARHGGRHVRRSHCLHCRGSRTSGGPHPFGAVSAALRSRLRSTRERPSMVNAGFPKSLPSARSGCAVSKWRLHAVSVIPAGMWNSTGS